MDGVLGSDIPTQSPGGGCRVGDLHLAFVVGKGVVKVHAQWWHSEMIEKIDTQSRQDPSEPFAIDGGGAVLSARVAEDRNRVSGQELRRSGQERRGKGTSLRGGNSKSSHLCKRAPRPRMWRVHDGC